MGVSIKLEGLEELQQALENRTTMDDVHRIVHAHGASLQQNAQSIAPFDTGTLRRSIGLDIEEGGDTATITAGTNYAGYVEWGTRFMNAQPYMKPSYEKQKTAFITDLKKLVR